MDIRLLLPSVGPHCKPISCGVGRQVFLSLKEGKEGLTADGSGIVVATIVASDLLCASAGGGQWDYGFTIDESEIAPSATLVATDILSVCCIECDSDALLRKLRMVNANDSTSESFRVFGDDEIVETGEIRLFRRHSTILLRSMEVSVARIDGGYPYSYDPGKLFVKPLATPEQALGPWAALVLEGAVIDHASSTPLTARYDFVPPLLLEGGRAFGVGVLPENEGAHFGLEVHLQFSAAGE